MMPFDLLYYEVAKSESRMFHVFDRNDLPSGIYVFREFYCTEPHCDCRRVLLQIHCLESKRVVATVNYAFELPKPPFEDEGQMFLDPLNPQSNISPVLFHMFKEMITNDRAYHDRLVRHYKMWKRVVDDPNHPHHAKVRHEPDEFSSAAPARPQSPKIGPNDPCPCGSSKKFKKCCRSDKGRTAVGAQPLTDVWRH
jgi:hypothetical protein